MLLLVVTLTGLVRPKKGGGHPKSWGFRFCPVSLAKKRRPVKSDQQPLLLLWMGSDLGSSALLSISNGALILVFSIQYIEVNYSASIGTEVKTTELLKLLLTNLKVRIKRFLLILSILKCNKCWLSCCFWCRCRLFEKGARCRQALFKRVAIESQSNSTGSKRLKMNIFLHKVQPGDGERFALQYFYHHRQTWMEIFSP